MEFAVEFPLPRHGEGVVYVCSWCNFANHLPAFHGAPSHQLSVLPFQSSHFSSTHWLFKNTYVFHRSVALCFWLFLRGICFLYILASERKGRLPSVFMAPQHWTSACTVSLSCRHVGILCRDAQKGMLGTEQHTGIKSMEPGALRVVQPGLVFPEGLVWHVFKGRWKAAQAAAY